MLQHFRKVLGAIVLLGSVLLALPAALGQDTRTVDVRFPRGTSGTTISDTITGYQSVNYRLGVSAGQRMNVQLDTNNASAYFNITAPGASEALYNSSISGNSTSVVIPSSGNYVINVYLMRNAARRNETASYALTLYVEGAAAAAPRPPQQAPAPRPDYADGLQGGPDLWRVEGLSGGDTLNVRSGPSTGNPVLGTVRNGDTLRNLGCTMNGSTRWCQVQTASGIQGWVAGRYLHESFGQATTLPAPVPTPLPIQVAPQPSMSLDEMGRFCVGEASQRLGLRPQYLNAPRAIQTGNTYTVLGSVSAEVGTAFFTCTFDSYGQLQSFRN